MVIFHSYVTVYQRVRGVPNLQEDASNFVMREESRINTFQRKKGHQHSAESQFESRKTIYKYILVDKRGRNIPHFHQTSSATHGDWTGGFCSLPVWSTGTDSDTVFHLHAASFGMSHFFGSHSQLFQSSDVYPVYPSYKNIQEPYPRNVPGRGTSAAALPAGGLPLDGLLVQERPGCRAGGWHGAGQNAAVHQRFALPEGWDGGCWSKLVPMSTIKLEECMRCLA